MKPINIIVLIVCLIIFLTLLSIILFKYYNEKIKLISKRLEGSEIDFVEKLKNKYNILIRMINIIENRYKTNSKTFDDVKKIKIEDLASLQNENLKVRGMGLCSITITRMVLLNTMVSESKEAIFIV